MSQKKKEQSKDYFGEKEENAVIEYTNTDSLSKRNAIYNEILCEPFRIMVEAISKRYPIFLGEYTIEEVQLFALSHLVEQMVKYNPNKRLKSGNKPKAFSYCQTIVRNFYRHHSKKEYEKLKRDLDFDLYSEEFENKMTYEMEEECDEYINLSKTMIDKINNLMINNKTLTKNELIVGEAIVNLLENWEILFLEDNVESKYYIETSKKYAKSKVLFLLKEQTRMSTKEIRNNMKPFSVVYFDEKEDILRDNLLHYL